VKGTSPAGEVVFKSGSKSLGSEPLKSGVATFKTSGLPVGNDSVTAVYQGDASQTKSTSNTVKELVNKIPTTLSAVLSATSVTVGPPVQDSAKLAAADLAKAGGTVTYTIYSDNTCMVPASVTGFPDAVAVVDGVVPASTGASLPAGTYYWQAVYKGDPANASSSSACESEVVTLQPTTLTAALLLSTASNSQPDDDAATLAGAAGDAGGTVTYTIYSDSMCMVPATVAGFPDAVTVVDGVVPVSMGATLPEGTYYWQAVYKGDSQYAGSTSSCIAESVIGS
jgi:hypothetical protein